MTTVALTGREYGMAHQAHADLLRTMQPYIDQAAEIQEQVKRIYAPICEAQKRMLESLAPTLDTIRRAYELAAPISFIEAFPVQENYIPLSPITYTPTYRVEKVVEPLRPTNRIKRNRAFYILPKDAVLARVRVKFVDGHTVKVKYPDMPTKTFDYKDFGFVDNRTNNPDIRWKFMRAMAENGGSLTASKYDRRFRRNTKYELSEGLKEFFGLGNREILPRYSKQNGYCAHIMILSETDYVGLDEESSLY